MQDPRPTPRPWVGSEFLADLVSVVIPSFNRADVIGETLDSVVAQSYRPIEIVVIDDGSSDHTSEVVRSWARANRGKGVSVRCVECSNGGAPRARNYGASLSRGEFIQFLDSDDLLLPHKLGRSVAAIRSHDAMFAACDYHRFSGSRGNIVEESLLSERSADPHSHLLENKLQTLAPVYRRSALDVIGPWNEDLKIWQDTEFCLRVLLSGLKGVWIAEVMALVRDSPGSIMNRSLAVTWGEMLVASKEMERVASEAGHCDTRFTACMGRRLAFVARRLALIGEWESSEVVHREALQRMKLRDRSIHAVHRAGMRVLGCRFMRRLGLM